MKHTIALLIIGLPFLLAPSLFAQQNAAHNFKDSVNYLDFSHLWRADSIMNLNVADGGLTLDPQKFPFPEPLGFIGDNYQRFYIHFISVTRNKKNHFQYLVKGKSKVNENICAFTGTITIDSAWLWNEERADTNIFRQGHLLCSCNFYEEKKANKTGIISGHLKTNFCFYKGDLYYDNIAGVADGYCNNQFTGRWKSYNGNTDRKCNWGDYRIPDSKKLDMGAGEFSVAPEYLKFGWENYCEAYGDCKSDSFSRQKAITIEENEWWR